MMWSILWTLILSGNNTLAISTQMVGQYDTADKCEVIAKQLRQKEIATSDGLGYSRSKEITARCIQVN